jgi:hypothetical protein
MTSREPGPIESRILGCAAGLAAAFGMVSLAVSVAEWLTPRGSFGGGFLLVGLAMLGSGVALSRRATSTALRLAALWGGVTSFALLALLAVFSGYIDSKAAAYLTAMRSDLRSLDVAQEEARRESGKYSDTTPPGFRSSVGVSPPQISLTSDGWTASVTHAMVGRTCALFVGRTPLPPAVEERRPACTAAPFRAADHQAGIAFLVVGLMLAGLGRALEPRDPTADVPRPDTA